MTLPNLLPAEVLRLRQSLERDVIALIDDIDGELDRTPRPYVAEDLEQLFLDLDHDLIQLLQMQEQDGVFSERSDSRQAAALRRRHGKLRSDLQEVYQLLTGDRHIRHLHRRLKTWLARFRDLSRAEHALSKSASVRHPDSSG